MPLVYPSLSSEQGVSRISLYYQSKLPAKDLVLKQQIETVLKDLPAYGHDRIAWRLGLNPKRTHRVMKLFGLKPARKVKYGLPHKPQDIATESMVILHLLLGTIIGALNRAWQSDFTCLPGYIIYSSLILHI